MQTSTARIYYILLTLIVLHGVQACLHSLTLFSLTPVERFLFVLPLEVVTRFLDLPLGAAAGMFCSESNETATQHTKHSR